MTDHAEVDDELPPTTVPRSCQLQLQGFNTDDADWFNRFRTELSDLIVECGRFMDLSRLEAVTVGFDYDEALGSVDLGYESSIAKLYTKTDDLVGVAKALRVKRDGLVKAHIVVNANCVLGLGSQEEAEVMLAANIVAHELAHVAIMEWLELRKPGVLLSQPDGDWACFVMRDTALTIWDEYAACRLSATISSRDAVTARYAASAQKALAAPIRLAREKIKEYRIHGDVSQLLRELIDVLGNAFKIAAYLAGHLDGLEDQRPIVSLVPAAASSELEDVLSKLVGALRLAWETRYEWRDLEGLDGITEALCAALSVCGAHLTLAEEQPGSRVDVPFTAETLPNGEADMVRLAMAGMLGST